MPIYAYRCESCGFGKDVLQKMSDALLTDCPECGKSTFRKQVTAAGFQLKGSGWYVTDFRSGSGAKAPNSASDADATPAKDAAATPGTEGKESTGSKPDAGASSASGSTDAPAATPAATPAPASSGAGGT
ncbi:FmdB family zinc ribbon protein [Paraburkholderia sp.]|uniref:FmdB family zinc ribbon protein n=1 Tax=Paraburkholderia sp. TaxID=1926495 RepID=UPI003D6F3EE7